MRCVICGDQTDRPIRAALSHFRLYESGNWKWLRGNVEVFGWRQGFVATLGLVCPAFNTLRNWRHRKSRLTGI